MEVKVVLRKTQQRNNLDEELKDKYKTSTQLISATVRHDSRIAVVSIVFPACHVFKS